MSAGRLSLALLRGRELVELTTGQPVGVSRYAVEVHVRPADAGQAALWLVVAGGERSASPLVTPDGVPLRVRRVQVGAWNAAMRYADQLTDAAVMAHTSVRLFVAGELVMEYSAHAIERIDEGRYDEIGPDGYPMG